MSAINNFSELSEQELLQFADELVKKINSESLFTDEVNFKIDDVEADDMTGDMYIHASTTDEYNFGIKRSATWQCGEHDDVTEVPYDAEYEESSYTAIEKSLKTRVAEIDGYNITIDIDDTDRVETYEVRVTNCTDEDSGIGSYEYGSIRGYDSRPYKEVTAEVIEDYACSVTFVVEPK